MTRPKAYCFTINNPTDASTYPTFDPSELTYLVFQLETGDSGTPHLQGYIEFKTGRSLAAASRYPGLQRAHLERRRGSPSQAADYCKKSEGRLAGPWEFGIISSPGKRNDLRDFKDAVEGGLSYDEAFDQYPEVFARYPRYCADVFERRRTRNLPMCTFIARPGWQEELMNVLNSNPDPRQVLWYTDVIGNSGKSHFANNYEEAYVVTGGKHADIYFAYRFEKVVFFDWPRDSQESFPYQVVESFKNGYFLSTKYETKRVKFAVPHVVVFSNFSPDIGRLSNDRWNIKRIENQ